MIVTVGVIAAIAAGIVAFVVIAIISRDRADPEPHTSYDPGDDRNRPGA